LGEESLGKKQDFLLSPGKDFLPAILEKKVFRVGIVIDVLSPLFSSKARVFLA
jgi:hypothetical protein